MTTEIDTRDPKTGQFVKGVSGNPAGRPVGVRNQTTMVKEFIESALTSELKTEAVDILHVAIKKAKSGDNAMIKLLLGDLLSEVRREATGQQSGNVTVTVNNLTEEPTTVVIDQEDING